jgi:hypothetical protein
MNRALAIAGVILFFVFLSLISSFFELEAFLAELDKYQK